MGVRKLQEGTKYYQAYHHPDLGAVKDTELAETLGVGATTVRKARRDRGIKPLISGGKRMPRQLREKIYKDPDLLESSPKELAKKYGVTSYVIFNLRAKKRSEIEGDQYAQINNLLKAVGWL